MHVKEGYFFTPPKQVTSPTWGLPPPCKQALSYTFYGGNVVRVLVHFFFTAAHFHLALVAASISHFVTAATKFSCCSSNKKMSPLFFISRSRSLSPFFSLSFAGLPPTFSFSLSFSCSIFQICGHDNYSELNTLENTDTETISAFRLLSCLCFTRTWGYAISRQNNLELHLGCHTC